MIIRPNIYDRIVNRIYILLLLQASNLEIMEPWVSRY